MILAQLKDSGDMGPVDFGIGRAGVEKRTVPEHGIEGARLRQRLFDVTLQESCCRAFARSSYQGIQELLGEAVHGPH